MYGERNWSDGEFDSQAPIPEGEDAVIVQADKTVTELIRVIDEAKLAGALSVNVSTD